MMLNSSYYFSLVVIFKITCQQCYHLLGKHSGFQTDMKAIDETSNQKPIPANLIEIMTMFAKKPKNGQFLSLEAEETRVLITATVVITSLGFFPMRTLSSSLNRFCNCKKIRIKTKIIHFIPLFYLKEVMQFH